MLITQPTQKRELMFNSHQLMHSDLQHTIVALTSYSHQATLPIMLCLRVFLRPSISRQPRANRALGTFLTILLAHRVSLFLTLHFTCSILVA